MKVVSYMCNCFSNLHLLLFSCMCGMPQVTPIIQADGVSYMYVQYSNLYLLVVTRENVNATSMLLFLHKLKEVFVHYFNELEEESLRDNFVIAYELLDEVLLRLPCTCLGLSACLVQSLMLQKDYKSRSDLAKGAGSTCYRTTSFCAVTPFPDVLRVCRSWTMASRSSRKRRSCQST